MEEPRLKHMKKRTAVLLLVALVAALIGLGVVYGQPLWELFSDQERIETLIKNAGPWGPAVFMLLQAGQVLAAPIPGQITAFVGGYLFGTVLGGLYALIGMTIGFTLVFVLSRKLGRPFVEYFVNKKTLKKFDYLAESRGVFIFFLMALLPFFPDDLICFVAGLTKIPIRTLIVVTLLGRLPTTLVYAFAGQGVAEENTTMVLVLFAVGLVLSAVAWRKRDLLERFTQKLSSPKDKH